MNMLRHLCAAFLCLLPLTVLLANESGTGMKADEVLKRLKDGNARFARDLPSTAVINRARRDETVAKGQKPLVTILGCSDSREPLEHIFGAGVGDLFVIRVAGNVADTDELGSMEYGVDHLGTPVLLVLGHTSCGAVTAVATGAEVHGHIPPLVDNIVPAVETAKRTLGAKAPKEALVEKSITENVLQSMADILSKSAIIAKRAKEDKVMVIGGLYHLDTGAIDWLGTHPDQAALIEKGLAAGGGHGGTHDSSPWTALAIASALILAIGALFHVCFIADKRLFKTLKFKARLALSFIGLALALTVALVFHFKLQHQGAQAWGALLVLLALTGGVAAFYTAVHMKSFKKFFDEQIAIAKGGNEHST